MDARPLIPVLVLLLAGGCCAVRGLEGDRPELSAEEKARIDRQVERALEARQWAEAWNQAVDAGAGRGRLEEIALRAVADASDAGEAMLTELRGEYGGLTPEGLRRAAKLRDEALADGSWERAVRIELLTAEDGPAFGGAWEIYERAPPGNAPAVLQAIVEARSRSKESDG